MSARGVTRKELNRKVRQEAQREQLQAQGHIQHVLEIVEEVNDLSRPMESIDLQRKKVVIDTKLKIINKFLPDVKQQEIIDNTDVDKAMDKLTDAELEAIASGK
jgi:hypothetical protein